MGQGRKIAFTYEVGVSRQTIDQLSKLELELDQVNQQIKEARKQGDEDTYQTLRRQSQGLREEIKDLNKELRDQKRDFQDLSQAEGSIQNLRGQYRQLKRELDQLDSADPGFRKKAREAARLSDEIADLQKQSGNFFALVGRYEQEVGSALQATRGLFTGSITDIASAFTVGGAVVQGIELLVEAGAALIAFTDQFREAERIVGATTRAIGEDLEILTQSAIATSNTFQLEVNEIAQAQQQIQDNLGTSAAQTTVLLETSLLASADRAKTLSLINDEISKLASLGIPPDSALALITEASNRDINVDVLAEPIIRLREATPATVDALNAAFGPEATQELFESFREEPLEAIKQVSDRLEELGPTSQVAGLLLADVFSSPGEDAIIAAQSIGELADSLDDLIDPTNTYLAAEARLLEANKRLADEQGRLARNFNASGVGLKKFGTELKVFGLELLNGLTEGVRNIGLTFFDLFTGRELGESIQKREARINKLLEDRAEAEKEAADKITVIRKQQGETLKELDDRIRGIRDQLQNTRPGDNAAIVELRKQLVTAEAAAERLRKKLGLTKERGSDEAAIGLALLNKELAELNKQLTETDPSNIAALSEVLTDITKKEQEIRQTQIALRLLKEEILEPLPIQDAPGQDLAAALLDPVIRAAENLPDLQIQGRVAAVEAGEAPTDEGLERAAEIENLKQQEEDFLEFKKRMDEIDTEFKREQREIQLEEEEQFLQQREALVLDTLGQVATATGKFLTGQTKSFKEFAKELLTISLTALENTILISIAAGSAQAIGSKGPLAGGIEAVIITALIKALFAAVKSQIKSFGKGGYVDHFLIKGPSHAQGGVLINAEGGEGIVNKRAMASPEVMTVTGTPYEIASQINQAVPGSGEAFPGTPRRKLQKGGPVITLTGTPSQLVRQILQSGGVVEVEGGEGFVNKKAMTSPNVIQLSGTPYQITRQLNQTVPGPGVNYVGSRISVPSGIFQEGGVIGNPPQVTVPENITVTTSDDDQEAVAFFSPSQIQFLADAIATQVGQSVKIGLGEGLQDANRNIERQLLTDNEQNL